MNIKMINQNQNSLWTIRRNMKQIIVTIITWQLCLHIHNKNQKGVGSVRAQVQGEGVDTKARCVFYSECLVNVYQRIFKKRSNVPGQRTEMWHFPTSAWMSRSDLEVRLKFDKQTDVGSSPLRLSSLQKLWMVDIVSWLRPWQLMKH